jgi:hypothetical protein
MDPVTSFDQGPANIMPVKDPFVKRKRWFKRPMTWIAIVLLAILLVLVAFVLYRVSQGSQGSIWGSGTVEGEGTGEIGIRGADGINFDEEVNPDDLTGLYGDVGGNEEIVEVPLNLSCESDSYNCGDFESCEEVMVVFDACEGDVHLLDGNKDGTPCESLCVGE